MAQEAPVGTKGVDPEISGQPVPDFFVLVCGVVEDDVDFEIGIDAAFDGRELQELLMAVPGHAFMDDMACGR